MTTRSKMGIHGRAVFTKTDEKREPYEMTKQEYDRLMDYQPLGATRISKSMLKYTPNHVAMMSFQKDHPEMFGQDWYNNHRYYVVKALFEGKPVPLEVQKEYPNISRVIRPNLNNVVGLHHSNGSWANFLKDAELREQSKGIKHYISSNGHYVVLPDGEVITFYGYHGQNAYNEIVADKAKWLRKRDKALNELDEILHPKAEPKISVPERVIVNGINVGTIYRYQSEPVRWRFVPTDEALSKGIGGMSNLESLKETKEAILYKLKEKASSKTSVAENAAIHAYYDEHPKKDKLRVRKVRKHTHTPSTLGRMR